MKWSFFSCSDHLAIWSLTKGLTKRVKIKLKNSKIAKKLRKKCHRVTTEYRVYFLKYFQEALSRMVKTLIVINVQETIVITIVIIQDSGPQYILVGPET